MKRYITYLIIAIATMLMATSCEKDAVNLHSDDEGGFSLDLKINSIELETRALLTEAQVTALNPKVNIYMPNFEGLIRSYSYTSMPQIIYLPAGEGYRVDVVAGEAAAESPRKANFENKSYAGSSNFNIEAGKTSNAVKVTAKISNAITKVSFEESIATNFNEGYTLTVAVKKEDLASPDTDNKKLVYTASNVASDTKSGEGYFIIEDIEEENTVYWNFKGTLKKDNSNFSASGSFKATTDSDNDGKMDLVAARQNMVFRYDIKDGTLKFGITHDTATDSQDDDIIWAPKSTGLSTPKYYDIWATHLTISADVDAGQYSGAKFQYREKNTTQWEDASATKNTDGTYSAMVTGLKSSTTYEFRLLCTPTAGGEDVVIGASDTNADGNIKEVITASADQIPNAGLENSSMINNKYPEFYGSSEEQWWGSGNAGSGGFGYVICAVDTDNYKEGNQSARLQSTFAMVKFAAGNLFSGKYGQTIGTSGGTVYFGRPFEGRPSAIQFWVKGAPKKVTTGGDHLSTNDYDINQIKVALGTWDNSTYGGTEESPILINTTEESTFVDFNTDESTIAYGDLKITTDGTNNAATINGVSNTQNWNDWVQVTLPLVYRDLTTMPTHIVISCAASMYGDYFQGSEDSIMWVDDFKLIYDHNVSTK